MSGGRRAGSGGWVVLVVGDEGQLGVVRGEPRQGGCDELAGREGVAADDVDGDQVRPPAVAGDPRVAGVAGGAQLADVGFEVLGADARAAQHPGPLPHLGGPGPQDEREPPGAGVQPGLVAEPLEPVAGQDAPEPPGDEPAGVRHGQDHGGQAAEDDPGPDERWSRCPAARTRRPGWTG